MRQIQAVAARPRGRPQLRCDEDTRHLLVEAAACEFQKSGYAGTSMATVAQRAGISTKTMYRLIPTKADLFTAVVADRIGLFMLAIDDETLEATDLEEALGRILAAYGRLTLSPETIAINRLVIGESDRFPEISNAFYDTAVLRTSLAMERWLRRQCDRGLMRLDDPALAVGMLRGMMIMEPQRNVMLGRAPAPSGEEILRRARVCARLFLQGCRI
ncbi:TetR/AcrR family transcriptional regulator [Labrys monachus]|uniref:AcrR family transcriptional regulator n=1 Tax=Labrys monachus TaxID=217067 RepID=A0ABU0FH93_9HYPH|nr:TetR/AcrR family transcriptional regulator [Labrys monachus]MDQ0393988.1 AcrR family transcriptional regulator [Labrys monachus]